MERDAASKARKDRLKYVPIALLVCVVAVCASFFLGSGSEGNTSVFQVKQEVATAGMGAEVLFTLSEQDAIIAWNGKEVDHVPFENMTMHRFREEYQKQRRPVVITGVYKDSPLLTEAWGWQALRDNFGYIELENRIKRDNRHPERNIGCAGIGLCKGQPILLQDLMDKYFLREPTDPESAPYPHDTELRKAMPPMFKVYKKLSFFVDNMLLLGGRGMERWPSLFFGTKGTGTGLHVDNLGTSFTMAVFRGRKQFILFDPRDGPNLCMETPVWEYGLDYGIGIDSFDPDFNRCPAAKNTTALFASFGAGDLLYVPGSFHHAARNMESSLGISQNFLSLEDYESFLEGHFGYYVETKRLVERRGKGLKSTDNPVPITILLLSTWDLYRLLRETGYHMSAKSWDFPQGELLSPLPSVREAYMAQLNHLKNIAKSDPGLVSRLAYMSNYETLEVAIKQSGLWDCIDQKVLDEIGSEGPDHDPYERFGSLEPHLKGGKTGKCWIRWKEMSQKLQDAITSYLALLPRWAPLSERAVSDEASEDASLMLKSPLFKDNVPPPHITTSSW